MLILTAPGERIMDPEFGVGLRNYIFEFNGQATYSAIASRILSQVKTYLPYLGIDDIQFAIPEDNPDLYPHNLSVTIVFTIKPLQIQQSLKISTGDI
jgi:phage baseplate assembly protein W